MIPTLLIAAPASGQGKTTVTCALAAALGARGLDVRCFKVGPDYLDPTWHRQVTGRPALNLDTWMLGEDGARAAFARGAAGGDVALIEGMMGLFDGRTPRGQEGSAAALARLLNIPVVLVLDAWAMAGTAAAVVMGLARFDPAVRVRGVIFNRVGGEGHTALLREAMAALPEVKVLGGVRRDDALATPERHLGLVSAAQAATPGWAAALGPLAAGLHLDALLQLAETPSLPQDALPAGMSPTETSPRARIGVSIDEAFHFLYEDNLTLLRQAGATLVPFSPLRDRALPDVDGLYLCGGYPECHKEELSQNIQMRQAIRAFTGPIYAECGGLMYLGESIDGAPMVGALPLRARMTGRLRALGYREVTTLEDTLLGPAGTVFRGHEHRCSELAEAPALRPVYRLDSGDGAEGWSVGRILGSYVHAHFGSNPELAARLVAECAR